MFNWLSNSCWGKNRLESARSMVHKTLQGNWKYSDNNNNDGTIESKKITHSIKLLNFFQTFIYLFRQFYRFIWRISINSIIIMMMQMFARNTKSKMQTTICFFFLLLIQSLKWNFILFTSINVQDISLRKHIELNRYNFSNRKYVCVCVKKIFVEYPPSLTLFLYHTHTYKISQFKIFTIVGLWYHNNLYINYDFIDTITIG